ncbi:MAG TPA: ornithine carbamoyltransferase [bacterium]|nr:ornithine carbamoyltransferase [bacterium]HEX68308.1 ornithine carbamoyltransferase [bacterium]
MERHFLSLKDIEKDALKILEVSSDLKKDRQMGNRWLKGEIIGLLFEKPSTRTRVSFEVAIRELGGEALYLSGGETQLGRGETLADTARVLSRYLDGLIVRTYGQERLEELANHSTIPIINALTDLLHPCQILSDLFTIKEKKGTWEGIKIVYIGDGNNVCNSWIVAGEIFHLNLIISTPETHTPPIEKLKEKGLVKNEPIIIHDPREAVKDADVVYTDVWVSMGEKEKEEEVFYPYQVNASLLSLAHPDCIVMHCLPAHRGKEITDEVMDGENSVVWDQAENRLHVGKGIILWAMNKI